MEKECNYNYPIVEEDAFYLLDLLREQKASPKVIAEYETELAERLVFLYDDVIRNSNRRKILDQAAELAMSALKYWDDIPGDEAADFRYRLHGLLGSIDVDSTKNYLLSVENCHGIRRLECVRLAALEASNVGNIEDAIECTKAAIYMMLTIPVDTASLNELFYVQKLVDYLGLYYSMKKPLDIVLQRFEKLEVNKLHAD